MCPDSISSDTTPEEIVYLNGRYLPISQACVPVLDRGFIFGDGVYEVIPAYGGRLFRLDEHLDRLDNSLKAIRLDNPYDRKQWETVLSTLLQQYGDSDQSVYLQITRGVAKRDHGFPPNTPATVFAMSSKLTTPDAAMLATGIAAISTTDSRWQNCYIKTIALLPNILLKQEALDREAMEAILIRDGMVTEGTASNVFIVQQGVIKTPPKSAQLLPGITRDLVVELAHANSQACEEIDISEAELNAADEVWITSSMKEILPVTQLNDKAVGNGKPGPVWAKMLAIFQDYKAHLRQQSKA